jgi:hypothetical protein
MERDVLIGLVGGRARAGRRRLAMYQPLEVLLETGAHRRVRPTPGIAVAHGRSWSEPARGGMSRCAEPGALKRSVALWVLSRYRDNTRYAEHRIMPGWRLNRRRARGSAPR